MAEETPRLLKASEVARLLSVSLPSLYRGIARGAIPAPVHPTGQRAARWKSTAIAAYIETLGESPAKGGAD